VTGNNNPTGIEVKDSKDTISFHPYYTVKDLFAYVVFLLMFCYFIFYNPNILGHPDNYIEADPMLTPAHIVPEWYLLPFYAILRAVPDKLMGVLLMFGSIVVLFFLPWLDTMKVKSARYRPLYKIFFLLFVISCLLLGYLGAKPPEGIYLFLSRVSTIYYFAFFLLIMPILSRIEKPSPMPIGISNPAINNDAFDSDGGATGTPSYAMDSK
jgi:ubiquinol-cytochrome c reductase cytochrome b subunit